MDTDAFYLRCELCEHRCGVNRLAGQTGRCGASARPRVFQAGVEYGEEAQLIPSNVVYLGGCDLRCLHCISEESAFDASAGEELTASVLGQIVDTGRLRGAQNLQFSGGQPSIHAPAICQLLDELPDSLPVVWKSNLHETPWALGLLAWRIDWFVADLKFGNDLCAQELSGFENYLAIAERNLRLILAHNKLIIRHLLLPGHEQCCVKPLLAWVKQRFPDVPLSLRDGYVPAWKAMQRSELAHPLSAGVVQWARQQACDIALRVI